MTPAPARPWRRLAPLAVAVLALHVLLLQGDWDKLAPTRDQWVRTFSTRTITVGPSAPPAATPPPPVQAAPAAPPPPPEVPPSATPAPAPAPRAAEEAAAPSPAPAPAPQPSAGLPPGGDATPFVPGMLGLPQPAVMRYELTVQRNGVTLQGEARLDWWHNEHQYELRLELSGPGVPPRVLQSRGSVTDEGLAPDRFSDKSRGEQATHFDRAKRRLVFSNNQPQAPLVAGMQDRLSVLVQLTMLIAGEPARYPAGTQIAIPTATTREAQEWVFRVEGEEDIELPGGTQRALKLQRLPRREYDQQIEVWLAPRKDYAPVRLRLTNPDGGWVDQRWASTDKG